MSTPPALALVSVAGAVLTLAYPQPDIAPLAWVALAPLLAATQGRSVPRGFLLAWVFGLAFYGVLLSWETLLGVISWVPLVLLQSLFVGLFGALWAVTSRLLTSGGGLGHRATRNDALSVAGYVVLAASLWTAVDWLRSYVPLGGFTWGQLAQS